MSAKKPKARVVSQAEALQSHTARNAMLGKTDASGCGAPHLAFLVAKHPTHPTAVSSPQFCSRVRPCGIACRRWAAGGARIGCHRELPGSHMRGPQPDIGRGTY